jgi:hypothetical protein
MFYDIGWAVIREKRLGGDRRTEGKKGSMSDKHPECPLYNPLNCKEYFNPKLCAFVRKERDCLKKKKPKVKLISKETGFFANPS